MKRVAHSTRSSWLGSGLDALHLELELPARGGHLREGLPGIREAAAEAPAESPTGGPAEGPADSNCSNESEATAGPSAPVVVDVKAVMAAKAKAKKFSHENASINL